MPDIEFDCEKCGVGITSDTPGRDAVKLCTDCLMAAYIEMYNLFMDGKFGRVVWDKEDIETALEDAGKPVTDENIEAVLASYEVRHIEDRMIEAGWRQINSAVEGI